MFMSGTSSKIVTVYDDQESFGELFKLAGLTEATPGISQKDTQAMDFSGFWMEKSWENAVSAANSADVIIVSMKDRSNLPVPVKRWMDCWPHFDQTRHTRLVVVFGTDHPDYPKRKALISYFRQVAESHGMDFFCGNDQDSADEPPSFAAN